MGQVPGSRPGGIAGLVALLREHGAAIEADLQRYYGERLSDITTGRLSWRRLRVLITGLPSSSSLFRAVNGAAAEWSTSDHLLALTVDALQIANWQRSADGSKGRRPPKPIARPGVQDSRAIGNTEGHSPAEVRAQLARYRVGEGD